MCLVTHLSAPRSCCKSLSEMQLGSLWQSKEHSEETIFSAAILFCILNNDNSNCENMKEFPSAVGHEADFDTQMYWKDFLLMSCSLLTLVCCKYSEPRPLVSLNSELAAI